MQQDRHIESLTKLMRPMSIEDGYTIQQAVLALIDDEIAGWKIAATNKAGQKHICVSHPLAGRLLKKRVYASGARIDFGNNLMAVAEAEFAFVFAKDLPPRPLEYQISEIVGALATLHPAIELPDSRFAYFADVGAPTLIADNACGRDFVLGSAVTQDWHSRDLAAQTVRLSVNGQWMVWGSGADVLGGPLLALTWLVNHARSSSVGIKAGEIVTTGVCGRPCAVSAGDTVTAEFETLGQVSVSLT